MYRHLFSPHILSSICPGRHLALNSAWIAVASILATYDISKAVDDNGSIIEPKVEFTDGLVRYADIQNTCSSPHPTLS